MRDRDPSIDLDDLPEIQVEARDNLRERPVPAKKPAPAPAARPSAAVANAKPSGAVMAVLGVIIACLAFLAFQLYAQATKLDARVQDLENRLSSTDESLNQSGTALQVQIKELKARVVEQESQVAKLWDSAWKKNQGQIESLNKQLATLAQGQKKLGTQVTEQLGVLQKADEGQAAELKVIMARTETLSAMDASIKEQAQTVASLKKQLAEMEKTNTVLRKKVEDNAGWIESNNTFRQQTNQSLNRIEQQLKNLQPTSTTIITP